MIRGPCPAPAGGCRPPMADRKQAKQTGPRWATQLSWGKGRAASGAGYLSFPGAQCPVWPWTASGPYGDKARWVSVLLGGPSKVSLLLSTFTVHFPSHENENHS